VRHKTASFAVVLLAATKDLAPKHAAAQPIDLPENTYASQAQNRKQEIKGFPRPQCLRGLALVFSDYPTG
jgi:hypothetical protein